MDAAKIIAVDIDTTGLESCDEICRIAAFDHDEGFTDEALDLYMLPTRDFAVDVTKLNGYAISERNGKRTLLFDDHPVRGVLSQKRGIARFFKYICKIGEKNCILMLYNGNSTMAGFLIRGFRKHLHIQPENLYSDHGIRFVDPYLMLDVERPMWKDQGLMNLKQPTVYRYFFPREEPYRTPNALEDAKALSKIVKKQFKKRELCEQAVTASDCAF